MIIRLNKMNYLIFNKTNHKLVASTRNAFIS